MLKCNSRDELIAAIQAKYRAKPESEKGRLISQIVVNSLVTTGCYLAGVGNSEKPDEILKHVTNETLNSFSQQGKAGFGFTTFIASWLLRRLIIEVVKRVVRWYLSK